MSERRAGRHRDPTEPAFAKGDRGADDRLRPEEYRSALDATLLDGTARAPLYAQGLGTLPERLARYPTRETLVRAVGGPVKEKGVRLHYCQACW